MSAQPLSAYATVRTEGALLPADILGRMASGDSSLGGLDPASYHLDPSEKIGEATNRAWNRMQARWVTFQTERAKLAPSDAGTTITRERWLLPLFEELKFGRLQLASKVDVGGKSYAVSHAWQHVPIHLVGCHVDLDRRVVLAGSQRSSPHSLLQELLNRSAGHLWGVVSNGLKLRLLRDNISLTRQAYVEFDLEAMMAGEAYPDFVLLWLLLHQSRFEAERPELCQLEKWTQAARTEGVRVLEGLRDGVQKAIEHLGQGFLAHASNAALKEKLRSGVLDKQDYYRQLLRLVYRLLFLFVAEDRDLLLVPTADPASQRRYREHYATTRLRRLATTRAGSRHHDLYCGLRLVMDKLSSNGCPELALPALGSFLFSPRALADLNVCDISNLHLLEATRALAVTQTGQSRRVVDYKNLGAEELGSVYESLLELHPDLNAEAASFELKVAAGSERKNTGSYYTPTSLISCLLDSALDPVLTEAAKQAEPEAAVLKLKVVDPACGSGHFLIAAAHRIAKRLAAVRTGEEEPPPEAQRKALRDVIGHCVYGVDVNPMAVELCKVSLWMEALEPGKPLSFLEHRIQCGNSLLGATPSLLARGIPDEAFTPIEGDDKEICREFKRINKDERDKQMRLFAATTEPWQQLGNFAASLMNLDNVRDDSIEAIREKERMYEEAIRSGSYLDGRFWADTWCAAFVWKKSSEFSYPITEEVFRRIERNPHACEPWMRREIERLAAQYHFFHWHFAFPDVFRLPSAPSKPESDQMGWNGGFDAVVGNPPWENVRPEEPKFFAAIRPEIAAARTSAVRKQMIDRLDEEDPPLARAWADYKRGIFAESQLIKSGKMLPLSTEGNLNTYRLFAELAYHLTSMHGRAGMIVQTGMATDESGKEFFGEILSHGRLVRFIDFENKGNFFPDVHAQFRFALLTMCGAGVSRSTKAGEFGWLLHDLAELSEPGRLVHLVSADVELFNPFSRTCPVFHSEHDFRVNRQIYSGAQHIWIDSDRRFAKIEFLGTMFDMSRDSGLFESQPNDRGPHLPLYEAKYIHQFDHRYAGYWDGDYREVPTTAKVSPTYSLVPKSWVIRAEVDRRGSRRGMNASWMIGFRDVASSTNERTAIMAIFPYSAVGNNINLALTLSPIEAMLLCGNINAFALDYACRQKMSGMHVNIFIMRQLPAVPLAAYERTVPHLGIPGREWVTPRALELTYSAWDLQPFAAVAGHNGPPFRWDEERRMLLRCELDALYFHLYGLSREDTAYILDSFPIVRRKDEVIHAEYRTKRVILEIYDAMAEAERTGVPYQTRLDPPPADPSCCHPRKQVGVLAFGSLVEDPGQELEAAITMRIETQTPFPVEYGRFSGRTRGGAPTLVPHCAGAPVRAEILVLDDGVSITDARDMLWRRERRRVGSGETYVEGTTADSVLVRSHESPWVETVLYTDFNAEGKIAYPAPEDLARRALQSVQKANAGKDGISYLMSAIGHGIETRLTAAYKAEVLRQTQTNSLTDALQKART